MNPLDDAPSPARQRRGAALSGVLAAGLTLGVAHLVAAIVDPPASPLPALGDAFIDLTPEWLKEAAIAAFGLNDKLALGVGMAVVILAVAALTGIVAQRRLPAGQLVVVLLGAVAGLAAVTRPQTGSLAAVPSVVGAVAGMLALQALVTRLAPPARSATGRTAVGPGDERPSTAAGASRRTFLRTAMAVGVGTALSTAAGSIVSGARSTATAVRRILLPTAARPAPPVPLDAQSPVAGVVDVVTATEDFYRIDTAFTVPQIDANSWELRVHGLVDREIRLTFDDLLARDLVESYVTLTCVSNPIGGSLAGNAKWLGLPVREVLAMAGPQAGADMVLSRSADGFTASTPLEALTDDRDALLAVGMNGEPLPARHGSPVRMVVPGLYGYVSATKWVVDLEVTRFADAQAYWTVRGWSERGPIKTASRIEVPAAGSSVPAGPVDVGGTAWAQHTGIVGVEVQVDDGPWEQATLGGEISIDTWRQWSWRWPEATPGRHTLRVRAADAENGVQTQEERPVVPDGATGWHEVAVTVR
ncbi:molybdopterin-dependent oxidoreductase [Actinotalea sp.]|uniref:molybdopterin-dependent oxidoreductase n=1 Tax=Actinotalea sp. TaxID=1872145 RepID=UPI003564B02E